MQVPREQEPISVTVKTPGGELVAELLTGPQRTFANIKVQIAGIEGTPVGNQTLLLGGRTIADALKLADVAIQGPLTVTLVHCEPLLSCGLTPQDLWSLLEDEKALDQAVDAYKEDPQYDVLEMTEIVAKLVSAILPRETTLASEILDNLPLNLLSESMDLNPLTPTCYAATFEKLAPNFCMPDLWHENAYGKDLGARLDASAQSVSNAQPDMVVAGHATAAYFEMDPEPIIPQRARRRERRERFIYCLRAALEVLRHALSETSDNNLAVVAQSTKTHCRYTDQDHRPLGCAPESLH